jgi:hypothetical protein
VNRCFLEAVTAGDVADDVVLVVTFPRRSSIAELCTMTTSQP